MSNFSDVEKYQDECAYFIQKMIENDSDDDFFMYNLHAFLGASYASLDILRSVNLPGINELLQDYEDNDALFIFFKAVRNAAVHIRYLIRHDTHIGSYLQVLPVTKTGGIYFFDADKVEDTEYLHRRRKKQYDVYFKYRQNIEPLLKNNDIISLCREHHETIHTILKQGTGL